MSKRGDLELLKDINEAAVRIEKYIQHFTYLKFSKDLKTQDAVIRNLEIIGEAASKISSPLKKKYSDIPWQKISAMRNRLIHDYSGVNLDIVWQVVNQELPILQKDIIAVLENHF